MDNRHAVEVFALRRRVRFEFTTTADPVLAQISETAITPHAHMSVARREAHCVSKGDGLPCERIHR